MIHVRGIAGVQHMRDDLALAAAYVRTHATLRERLYAGTDENYAARMQIAYEAQFQDACDHELAMVYLFTNKFIVRFTRNGINSSSL
ncbi:MAG TPA: hypothetical protein VJ836_05345 [Candidatus Saccharimonadales bacterium]|nr:hypothetical protein [Candidatus Saccharimonadales bacterium]